MVSCRGGVGGLALVMLLASAGVIRSADEGEVVVIPIEGMIDGGLAAFVERAVTEADAQGAEAIVFEINTFGGRVDSATEIRDTIMNARSTTIAWVNKRAISAGALITLSAEKVAMAKGASIGAATAVDASGKKASEKIISYFRAEMRATAERRGRSPELAEAMVDEEIDIPNLAPKGRLLTLTTQEAVEHGIADAEADRLDEALALAGLEGASVRRVDVNWAEDIVRFLTHPIVSSLLMTVGFLGLLAELRTPGLGFPGIIGFTALALFFGGHLIVELASWAEVLLFLVGILLILLEVLVIPGFGVAGVMGIASIGASLFLSLVGESRFWSSEELWNAFTLVGLSLIVSAGLAAVILKTLPRTSLWDRVILATELTQTDGYASSPPGQDGLVGQRGVTLTYLRPAGMALVDGQRVNVVTEGTFIPQDTPVEVIATEGTRVVVREAT